MEYYLKQVKESIQEWGAEYDAENIDDLRYELSISDAITGNASGSFFCNAYKAQEAIDKSGVLWDETFIQWVDDMGLEWGEILKRGAENLDVLARCCALDMLSDDEIKACLK